MWNTKEMTETTKYIKCLDQYMKDWFDNYSMDSKSLKEALQYTLFSSGKRIRPLLMYTAFSEFSNNYGYIIPFSAALECIHTYSLIHDDLPAMDDDDYRRGELSSHKVFGEGMAILAGDGLLNMSMEFCLDGIKQLPIEYQSYGLKAMEYLFKSSGAQGMIDGQAIDISDFNESFRLKMYEKKTGCLLAAALAMGTILGSKNKDYADQFYDAGIILGISYQLMDDYFDLKEEQVHLNDDELNKVGNRLNELAKTYTHSAWKSLKSMDREFPKVETFFKIILERRR